MLIKVRWRQTYVFVLQQMGFNERLVEQHRAGRLVGGHHDEQSDLELHVERHPEVEKNVQKFLEQTINRVADPVDRPLVDVVGILAFHRLEC